MNIKAFMAIAVVALTAACTEDPQPAPPTEAVEVPEEKTGGPCGDGTVLSQNEVCP